MIETLQLEEPVLLHDAPRLLIEWPSRWEEFVTSVRPALSRSGPRLAGEAPYGVFPYRGMLTSWFIEAFLISMAIVLPIKIAQLRPYVAPRLTSHDVIYYSGDELPRTDDLGGAQSGTKGLAGGSEAHHRTQTIRIARGGSLVEKVLDAPNLKLPASKNAVANLLAITPNPGPPPMEGVRSSRRVSGLTEVVAPAPNVVRDYTRGGLTLESVVAPAPDLSREHQLNTPILNAAVIPPAPSVSRDHTLIAPSLGAPIVAPAPTASREKMRNAPSLAANVVPPAPGVAITEISRSPVQMTSTTVVPPPVSSPERESSRNARLTMPAPSVVAPPPTSDVSPDLRRLASGSVPDAAKSVIPPPPTQAANGSFMSTVLGKIFGTTDVVPPPPTATAANTASRGSPLTTTVAPPPPGVSAGNTLGTPSGLKRGTEVAANVVAPPPSVAGSGSSRAAKSLAATNVVGPPPSVASSGSNGHSVAGPSGPLASTSVVPPPPSISSTGHGGDASGRDGAANGTLLAENVLPPPPSLGGGTALSGLGGGTRGSGLGGTLAAAPALAPPAGGGSGGSTALIVSKQPGSTLGVPSGAGTGSLALSPAGGDKSGLDGNGGGSGIGRGSGPGSGLTGEGTGAGRSGMGHGSDPNARGGISPAKGPGGAGNDPSGTPPVPGVSVTGGSTIVTLPSFDSDPSANDPSSPRRSSLKRRQTFGVDVVATATSAGAFAPYKNLLHGEKHTAYIDTPSGTVVMEYAEEASAGHAFAGPLAAPQQVRADLPSGLPKAQMVVACILDASGNLKNIRVLEAGPATMTAKVLAALRSWKFQPAQRGNEPVEVTAILGFNIDTNDHF